MNHAVLYKNCEIFDFEVPSTYECPGLVSMKIRFLIKYMVKKCIKVVSLIKYINESELKKKKIEF